MHVFDLLIYVSPGTRKEVHVITCICFCNAVLDLCWQRILKEGRGQRSPVSLLSSAVGASAKKAPGTLSCSLLVIY